MVIKTKFYHLRNCRTGRFYLGQEKVDRQGNRHDDSVYTKLLGDWKHDGYTVDWFGISEEGHHLDKQVHKRLRVHPDCTPDPPGKGSNELFDFKGYSRQRSKLLCEQYIQEEFGKSENIGELRKLYHHQEQFLIKIKSLWENWKDSVNEFVLFAKCRAGKCTMVYSALVELKTKVTLIVARQKSPESGWANDINYSNFDNLVFINLKDSDAVDQIEKWYKTEKQLVLWSTVQGDNHWKKIPYNVDLIVYDEADVGVDKPQWNELRDTYSNSKVLYVTGTAYKLLYRFDNDQVFNYSYPEEQREKKLGLTGDRVIPTMIPRMIEIDTPAFREHFGDDIATGFKNIWNTPNKKTYSFVYTDIVNQFINQFNYNPKFLPHEQPFRDCTHIIGHLPSVAACHASVEYWKGTRFAPLVVTGDTDHNEKSINDWIKAHPNGSIILTQMANVRGSTYELVDTVMNMCEGKSLEFYIQFMFRGGSGNKEKWYFYDFSPERRLVSKLEEVRIGSVAADPSLEDYKFTDMYPIEVLQNGWRKLSEEEVDGILLQDSNQSKNACANFWSYAKRDVLKQIGCDTEYSSPEMVGASPIDVNSNDTNGKGNQLRPLTEKEKKKAEEKTLKQIKEYSKRLPLAILSALRNNSFTANVRDFLKTPSFIHTTGDIDGVIMKALDMGAMSLQKYSTHLNEISKKVKKLLETTDLITAIEYYEHSGKDQKSLPQDIIRKQLKGLDRKSKIIIDGDPCGKHSLIAIKEGFSPENITVWEDDDRHHYAIKSIDDRINITDDYDALIYNQMRFTRAIGNPPYGSGGNAAIKHVNKLSQLTDEIHLVLPISMRTESALNKISLDIVCSEDEDIPEGTFPKGIKAVEQLWVKGKREKIPTFRTHSDFTFVKKEDNPDVMMFRCGASAGKLKFAGEYEENKPDHYYMNVKDDSVIDVFKALYPEFVAVGLQQNGMPGISKHKLIQLYQNYIDTHE